ncbi:septum formation initiator family protein [Planococcus sp. N028]|uniref:Septum formation initiator family protein n=1 Tax=Planococcus shixiaomingii TaxID=3058393 RepID=A0ABT8N7G0_9BACL|nr:MULTISPECIES: septum formation initiator family protein [unclassified Planococcus (in: firmicutes)]MDN7243825.1 septum formation initiator family protein [Planococcus sp. N028]WKA54880.1 septum formation initiator family protein [Planococcus sp. N022]
MGLKREKKAEVREVTSIRNDYVRSVELQEQRQKAHKVRLFRRLSVFGLMVLMSAIWIGTTLHAQSQTLSKQEQLREEALIALQEVEQEQESLKEQIVLLNDDEYVGKFARKDLFVSKKGEIIFTAPKTEEKADEKE